MEYDSTYIYEFAQRLYRCANSIIASYTILLGLIGSAGAAIGAWVVFE